MSRNAALALASLSLFLLVFPLTLGKPGLPMGLKADESAYYLMALSLAHDGDLLLEPRDTERAFREFPFREIRNLIAMTDDGWETVYYGKPYVYSLFAAPFAALAGADGMLFFNLLLTVAMMWMGALYLGRFNPPGEAALFSAGFTLLSAGFGYAFWLQPEVFNMAAVAGACFALFHRPSGSEPGRLALRAAASGALLALAVYNKPMIAALALPLLWIPLRQKRWKAAAAWVLGAAVSFGAVTGLATALTGHPTAYLGVTRQGVVLCEPGVMPIEPEAALPGAPAPGGEPAALAGEGSAIDEGTGAEEAPTEDPGTRAWSWLLRVPVIDRGELSDNLVYFLFGRHTGLVLYLPFAALAFLLFVRNGPRSVSRWLLAGSLAVIGLFFLIFISWNWQGGGGFLGNRYFVNVYPAFLFLVTRLRPRWTTALGFAAAGLFLGPVLLTLFGPVGPEPTLQAHVRGIPYQGFPLELTLRNVPGYERSWLGGVRFQGRKDQLVPQGEALWVRGADRTEILVTSHQPLERLVFHVRSAAPSNRVRLELGEAEATIDLEAEGAREAAARVELVPGGADQVRTQEGRTLYEHWLRVRTETGRNRIWTRLAPPDRCPYFGSDERWTENFYLGAELLYLGRGEGLDLDVYAVEWLEAEPPGPVEAGELFEVSVRLANRSAHPWTVDGAARVKLSSSWLREDGSVLLRDGRRTELPLPLAPGAEVRVAQQVEAPAEPGRYVLELEPVFEYVAWFSDRADEVTRKVPVEVFPAVPEEAP